MRSHGQSGGHIFALGNDIANRARSIEGPGYKCPIPARWHDRDHVLAVEEFRAKNIMGGQEVFSRQRGDPWNSVTFQHPFGIGEWRFSNPQIQGRRGSESRTSAELRDRNRRRTFGR